MAAGWTVPGGLKAEAGRASGTLRVLAGLGGQEGMAKGAALA